jgi:secretion/DNA translocation related CpaE-like protein
MAENARIVLVTEHEGVAGTVRRLAALAGASVVEVAGAGVRTAWRSARMVVVGADLAAAVAATALPKRDRVVVVGATHPQESLWRAAVAIGAAEVLVVPADERVLLDLMGAAVDVVALPGSTIAVVGGCGGAGASTFAAALAVTSARAAPTVLVDGDCFGGGLDVLLGAEQVSGARWPDLAGTRGRLGASALADALVRVDGLAVLSWDRRRSEPVAAEATAAVLEAATRAFACVVVDLPRRFDPAAAVLSAAAQAAVIIVPATVRATAAAATVVARSFDGHDDLCLVVRDAGAGRLRVAEVADALGLTATASFHSEPAVASAGERGEPLVRRGRGSLRDACRAVLASSLAPPAAA